MTGDVSVLIEVIARTDPVVAIGDGEGLSPDQVAAHDENR
jgi:hypothetical protein